MPGVTGIGGVFFRARDREALSAWYRDRLGVPVQDWCGAMFPFGEDRSPGGKGYAVWSLFPDDTTYFGPGGQTFMVNFRVDDLDALLASLRAAGCAVEEKTHADEFGKFGWVTDPEGNRVELWEPPAS
jgi:predicted enzyme related to lactoylglutathione lyase